jgi:hypothetical protein
LPIDYRPSVADIALIDACDGPNIEAMEMKTMIWRHRIRWPKGGHDPHESAIAAILGAAEKR